MIGSKIIFQIPGKPVWTISPLAWARRCTAVWLRVTGAIITSERPRQLSHFLSAFGLLCHSDDDLHLVDWSGETDEQFCTREALRLVPAGVPWRIVPNEQIPSDRRWRAAWTLVDGVITPDLNLAKKIRKAELERHRKTVEEKLERAYRSSQRTGNSAKVIEINNKLTAMFDVDLAAKVAAVTDLSELDTFMPPELSES